MQDRPPYKDRTEGGARLARALSQFRGPKTVVVGLARGGVPVASEVARQLALPLDVLVVRRLAAPGEPDLAYGAIASGGIVVLNDDVVADLELDDVAIKRDVDIEHLAIERAEFRYRGDIPLTPLARRRVILVDDGLGTGASMRAAVEAVKARQPYEIIVAAPAGSTDACDRIVPFADHVVCPVRIEDDAAIVEEFYEHFPLIEDADVCRLLAEPREEVREAR